MTVTEFPLTFRQRWHATACQSGWSSITVPVGVRLRDQPNLSVLHAAIDDLVRRHEALRTTLHDGPAGLVQRVYRKLPLPIQEVPAVPLPRGLDPWGGLVACAAENPFRVLDGPLARVHLLGVHPADQLMVLALHHSLCDAWAAAVLARELVELIRANHQGRPPKLPRPDLQLGDYATWEATATAQDPPAFWHKQLQTGHPPLRLGANDDALDQPALYRSFRLPVLSPTTVATLRKLAIEHRTTLPRLLAAGVLASLRRHLQDEVTIGLWVSNRDRVELRNVVGELAELVPVRVDIRGDPLFVDLLGRVTRAISTALEHRVPMAALVPLIRSNRQRSSGPLFDVTINVTPTDMPGPHRAGDDPSDRLGLQELQPALEYRDFALDRWWDGLSILDYQHRPQPDGTVTGYLVANVTVVPVDLAERLARDVNAQLELVADAVPDHG
ncbi:hypothetical protein FDG2_1358 [Candidatus Protofrankia californiensis]|uniref:Condensation domain-containing protein n=1 Tax=Candidatus Protofrankia californiensis TaxID=1839754 RepID=A0A1C3NVF0_9ACTN|nr:hypothetical protein FDG2_1358 [Candidatus Protofrankia californiensis]